MQCSARALLYSIVVVGRTCAKRGRLLGRRLQVTAIRRVTLLASFREMSAGCWLFFSAPCAATAANARPRGLQP